MCREDCFLIELFEGNKIYETLWVVLHQENSYLLAVGINRECYSKF